MRRVGSEEVSVLQQPKALFFPQEKTQSYLYLHSTLSRNFKQSGAKTDHSSLQQQLEDILYVRYTPEGNELCRLSVVSASKLPDRNGVCKSDVK